MLYLIVNKPIGRYEPDRERGPATIVTGFAGGRVECCWYDGFRGRSEAYPEETLLPQRLPQACLANGAGHRALRGSH
nr:hypothetical protein [Erwinia tasmaniensis]